MTFLESACDLSCWLVGKRGPCLSAAVFAGLLMWYLSFFSSGKFTLPLGPRLNLVLNKSTGWVGSVGLEGVHGVAIQQLLALVGAAGALVPLLFARFVTETSLSLSCIKQGPSTTSSLGVSPVLPSVWPWVLGR